MLIRGRPSKIVRSERFGAKRPGTAVFGVARAWLCCFWPAGPAGWVKHWEGCTKKSEGCAAPWCAAIPCGWVRPILNPHGPRSEAGRHRFDRDAAIRLEIVLQAEAGSTPKPKSRRCVVGLQNGRPPEPLGRTLPRAKKIGVRHGVLGPWVLSVINAGNVESMEVACRNATEEPSEANLVKFLDLWSAEWKHQGRTRAVGPGAFDKYCTLGLFGHGGVCGVSNATAQQAACAAVNRFLKSRFPGGVWTSIAVLFNPHMGLHHDIQNMIGQPNHAIALGDFTGGRVWVEDDEGDSTARLATKKGERELRGRWIDMHDKPVSFDARRYHMVEPHQGSMWALAAYVPQAYARSTEQHRQALREAGFPLPGN